MKLTNITNVDKFFEVVDKCEGKVEMLTENDEYTFDEDKNTKQEVQDIYNLLKKQQEYFWNEHNQAQPSTGC